MISNPLHYEMELTSFLWKNKDKKEIDYILHEKRRLSEILENLQKVTDDDIQNKVEKEFDAKTKKTEAYKDGISDLIKYEIDKHSGKINYMKSELRALKIKEERVIPPKIESEEEIDLSNSSASITILRLNEAGVIDLLRKQPCFSTSTNNLAKFLSPILKEKVTTLQSILNPMINPIGTSQKNNPYSSNENVKKVKAELIHLGFNSINP